KRRARLNAPMPRLEGDDVDRLEAADHRAVGAETAELHLEMDLVGADVDRRALVPLAARPAVTGPRHEIAELVVAVVIPDDDLAAGQAHMGEVAGVVDGGLVAAVQPRHIVVEGAERLFQRIAHRWPSPTLMPSGARPPTLACGRPPMAAATMNTISSGRGPSDT